MELKTKFINNTLENIIINTMLKSNSEDIYDKCVLDVGLGYNLLDFYLDYLNASLVTVITAKDNLAAFIQYPQIDVLKLNLSERVGAFSSQFDLVNAYGTFNFIHSDSDWQTILENLLFYIRPGGFCLINGSFPKITEDNCRSKGVWKAVLAKCGCSILSMTDYSLDYFDITEKIMVVKKCKI